MADVRRYIQLKPICRWLRKKLSDDLVQRIIHFGGHRLANSQPLIGHRHSQWRFYKTGNALLEYMDDIYRLFQFGISYDVQPLVALCAYRLESSTDLTRALKTLRSCMRSYPVVNEVYERLQQVWVCKFGVGDDIEPISR